MILSEKGTFKKVVKSWIFIGEIGFNWHQTIIQSSCDNWIFFLGIMTSTRSYCLIQYLCVVWYHTIQCYTILECNAIFIQYKVLNTIQLHNYNMITIWEIMNTGGSTNTTCICWVILFFTTKIDCIYSIINVTLDHINIKYFIVTGRKKL